MGLDQDIPEEENSEKLQRERDDAIRVMKSVFDASGMGMMVMDHHGRIVRMNDTMTTDFGWAKNDLIGEEFTRMLLPEDQEKAKKRFAAFIDHGQQGAREMQIMRKDGMVADIVITTALLELSQGRSFMVATVQDITMRKSMMRYLKKAKEEADSANKAKSSFLANMSHELRTPLNAIIGFAEMMKNGTFGKVENTKYQGYLEDIHFSARHLLEIINDVLDMSKIEAGRVDLEEEKVSISETLGSVIRIMGDRATAAEIQLDVIVEDDVPSVYADQRLLRQILINLVSNAVKFSRPGSAVRIYAKKEENNILITVEDEGCGIPSDMIDAVMEPFSQVKDPRNQSGQGTGLGLPLARAMTELHEGTLKLISEEGKGTVVSLHIPLHKG